MSTNKVKPTFYSTKMRIGLTSLLLSVAWSLVSIGIDQLWPHEFSWFAASGAVMVAGSIIFERLSPGTGLGGGSDFMSLPILGQEIDPLDSWMMRHGGKISILVLIVGTLIWAYGSLVF